MSEEAVRALLVDALLVPHTARPGWSKEDAEEIVHVLRPVWHEMLVTVERLQRREADAFERAHRAEVRECELERLMGQAGQARAAARRIVQACGCGQEGGCEDERGGESAGMSYVKHRGCARFVRAVRGEGA